MQEKFHYIYQITNLLNNQFYIGMHSTIDLNDGYFGSGTRLKRSIKKYGIENFKMEILETLLTKEDLIKREIELVTNDLIKSDLCLNLKPGGSGGFCNEIHAKKAQKSGGESLRLRAKQDPEFKLQLQQHVEKHLIPWGNENPHSFRWNDLNLSEDHKRKIGQANSIKQKGEMNSQFGTCWINNGLENKKIKKEDLQSYLLNNWITGRKMKF